MRPDCAHSVATWQNCALPRSRSLGGSLRQAGSTLKKMKFTNCRFRSSVAIPTSAGSDRIGLDYFILPFVKPLTQGQGRIQEKASCRRRRPGDAQAVPETNGALGGRSDPHGRWDLCLGQLILCEETEQLQKNGKNDGSDQETDKT